MADRRLYLIDATAFCYRAFYAIRGLSTSFGQPTGAIYGFINMLNKILKDKQPPFLAVCFDVSKDTFRKKKFAEYKLKRPPMPEGLSSQMPFIKDVISAYGLAMYELEGYEADDIIATLVSKARAEGLTVTIVSSDKDILQLIDEDTVVFSPYKDEGLIYDAKKVQERFGVGPSQITDIIALMGDDVDNIPGVPGIGEKTAVELIKDFGSLDNLLGNIDKIENNKTKEAIQDNIKQIKLSRELAVLDENLELDFSLDKLKIGKPDTQQLYRLFKYFEFKSLLKSLETQDDILPQINIEKIKPGNLENLNIGNNELYLYGENPGDLVFYANDKFFKFDTAEAAFRNILSGPKTRKISHDLKKIKISLAKEKIDLSGLFFDTMVAAYLLNPSKPEYTLSDVAWDYLGKVPSAKPIDSQSAVDLILKLKPRLEKELKEKSLIGLFNDIEMPLIEVLAQMELNGIQLDLKVLKELSADTEKRLIKLIEDIYALCGCQFNINSPKQLRDVLFEKLKLPVIKKTKTGPSTDEEVLTKLAKQHKLPALLLEYRQLMKLKTTYIDTLPDLVNPATGRVHSSFNQAATETGRLSSTRPNLQNIPIKTDIGKNIRRAIVAYAADHRLLSCDYSQIELRILAHLSNDENLISAFKAGKDIHNATASLIYGMEENNITGSMRELAKRVNFGIVYGLSSYGLARDLGISLEEAQQFIDAYFLRYPQVKLYIQEQIARAKEDGFATTILGRKRYIPEIDNKNQGIRQFAERQAVNTPIQGSAADMIKLAMIKIHNQIRDRGLETKMIIQIHDELLFDVPTQELDTTVNLVKESMENVLKLTVPIKAEVKIGRNWLEMEGI